MEFGLGISYYYTTHSLIIKIYVPFDRPSAFIHSLTQICNLYFAVVPRPRPQNLPQNLKISNANLWIYGPAVQPTVIVKKLILWSSVCKGVARILPTGGATVPGANQCSTPAFLGRGTDDSRRKFLLRNFYFQICLS